MAVRHEDVAAFDDGGVNVIYGSTSGLTATGDQFWSQNSSGIFDNSEPGDQFGSSLAASNFGKSSHADIVAGVHLENLPPTDAGGVNVIYGSSGGLTATGNQFWSQNSAGIVESAEEGDVFGGSVAAVQN